MSTMFGTQPQTKKQPPAIANDNVLEALRGIGSSVGKTLKRDVAGGVGSDILSSLTGSLPKSGELKPNTPIEVAREQAVPRTASRPEFTRPQPVILAETGLEQKIESVRTELKSLSASLKSLNTEVQKAISEVPVEPGTYHLNFFDRLRSVLLSLREHVEDSRSWLSLWSSRKRAKGYWAMFKKHGTKFGLSSERTMATQAG